MFNADLTCSRCRPATAMAAGYDFYRNGQSDDLIFVWSGGGWLETNFGRLRYRADDYIVIPRGTIYRLVPDDIAREDYLILESAHPVRLPARYLHPRARSGLARRTASAISTGQRSWSRRSRKAISRFC